MPTTLLVDWIVFFALLLGGLVIAKFILYLLRDILDS